MWSHGQAGGGTHLRAFIVEHIIKLHKTSELVRQLVQAVIDRLRVRA